MTLTSSAGLDRAHNGSVSIEHDDAVDPAAKPTRRRFTREFKARIVDEYDAASREERGALLRREGLYTSHISEWRHQLAAVEPASSSRRRRPGVVVPRNRPSLTGYVNRTVGFPRSWPAPSWRWRSREKHMRSWSCSPRARTSSRSSSSDRHPPRRPRRGHLQTQGL